MIRYLKHGYVPFELRFGFFCLWTYPMLFYAALLSPFERRKRTHWAWIAGLWLFGWPFIILDVFYNWIALSFILLEWPQENMATTRLKRWDADGIHPEWIDRFKRNLNELDPGHV